MDLREYDHIAKSPDTFPKSTLLGIREVLERMKSPHTGLIDIVLQQGYVEPPPEYKWHGHYRIVLSSDQRTLILQELIKAAADSNETDVSSPREKEWLLNVQKFWKRCIDEPPIPYEEAKRNQIYFDLRNVSLVKFSEWLFRDDGRANDANADPWYHASNVWLDYHEERNASLFIELFKTSGALTNRYSPQKLERGLWAMFDINLKGNVYNLIWDSVLSVETKERLISSLYDLYENLYQYNFSESSGSMWWDCLAYQFHVDIDCGKSRDSYPPEIIRIQNAMFETLKMILAIPSSACQGAALHGLGHLRHPDTEQVIMDYIEKHPELDIEDRQFALACITGETM